MKRVLCVWPLAYVILLGGCQTCPVKEPQPCAERPVMIARYAATPVTVDGILDDEVWKDCPVYELSLADDALADGAQLQEPGEARLAWDDRNLYVGVRYFDADIVAEGESDQMHHYLFGDLAEVFLKPANNTWYWELYVTPHGKKTHLWFPGRGRMGLKSSDAYEMELHVAAQCQGTLNDWRDKDTSWTGEMAIPIAELTRHRDPFGPGQAWTIFVSRYNYGRYLTTRGPELTMTPKLPIASYHLYENYAELRLDR